MKIKKAFHFLKTSLLLGLLFSFSNATSQATIASWTYDSLLPNTTNPTSDVGNGFSSLVGITALPQSFTGLNSTTGCGKDNSGKAWSHANFDPGSSNEVNGVQYKVSTTGFSNIKFSWDQHFTNTAPNTVRLQYTINDGTTWTNFTMVNGTNTTICAGSINTNGCFETNAGDTYRRITVDLSSITTINNNANFGIRLVASYYQTSGQYRQSKTPASIATNQGNWRFDNVNFTGTPTTTGAVISGTATICSGSTNIKVTVTGGTSPYQVVYTDGSTNTTISNYSSGTTIPVTPGSTKTYTLISVTSSNGSGAAITPISGAAVITVPVFSPTITSTAGATICTQTPITFTTDAGMDSYTWTITTTGTYTTTSTLTGATANETITITPTLSSSYTTYTVNVTYTSGGCSTTTSSTTTVYALPTGLAFSPTPAATICSTTTNVTYTTASNTANYTWSISGTSGTDYTIVSSLVNMPSAGTSGGTTIGASTYSVTLTWLTPGSKRVTVNYSNYAAGNCQATSPASATTIVSTPATGVSISPSSGQTICAGGTFATMTVSATGTGNSGTDPSTTTYQWFKKNPGNISMGSASSLATSFTPPNIINAGPPGGNASGGYFVTVTSGSCSVSSTATGAFTINSASVGGTTAYTGTTTLCPNNQPTATITLTGNTGSTIQWQSSTTSTTSGFSDIIGATSTTLLPNQVGALTSTTYIRAAVTNGVCTSAYSTVVTINVTGGGGTITGSASVCSGINSTVLILTGSSGTIQWQSASPLPTSTFSNISGATSTTYTASNLTADTYYRAVITNGSCASNSSVGSVTISLATTTYNNGWSNSPPNNTTKAIFSSNYTSTGDLQACSMQINPNVIVTVQPNHTFTITNEVIVDQTVNNQAKLIFEDSASLIQINPNITNTTPIYYKRNSMPMKKYDYTYWSSPVSSQVLNVFSPDTMADKFYKWDTTTHYWSNVASNSMMNPATGYIVRAPDVDPFNVNTPSVFNGQFFSPPNNGTITSPIAYSVSDDSYNLIGNPYPGALDADAFLNYNKVSNGGVLSGTMYFWTHNTPVTNYSYSYNDYASYNLTGGTGTIAAAAPSNTINNPCNGCNSAIPNGKVGAGQSFFIQGLANGVATFNNTMRSGINSQFFKSNNSISSQENNKSRIWLDFYNNVGLYKQILIGYLPDATNDYDTSFDGPILDADNPIQFYSILNDKKLGIQGRALPFNINDEIPLGFKTTVAGNFEIKLSSFDGFFDSQEVYLKDSLNNVFYNLKNGNYTFSTSEGTFEDRFKILFIDAALSTLNFSPASTSLVMFKTGNTVGIKSEGAKMSAVEVYDIQGRLLNDFKNLNLSEFKFNAPCQNQILIIKVITDDNSCLYRKI